MGHSNITAKHPTTFEITKDSNLTKRGDCIIAVNATKGLSEFSPRFLSLCRNNESRVIIEFDAGGISDVIEGQGSFDLTFRHHTEMVGRRSGYVSDRTLMVHADKAARDIDRDLIHALRSQKMIMQIHITVEL